MATTGDLARLLGVTTQTIRAWSKEFQEFFDEEGLDTDGGRKPRTFKDEGVHKMLAIAELRAQGKDHHEIKSALASNNYDVPSGVIIEGEAPPPTSFPVARTQQMIALISEQRGEIKVLREDRERLQRELEAERSENKGLIARAAAVEARLELLQTQQQDRESQSLREQGQQQEAPQRATGEAAQPVAPAARPWWKFWG